MSYYFLRKYGFINIMVLLEESNLKIIEESIEKFCLFVCIKI